MSNYSAGHNAEERAAEYLRQQGYEVRELNWKTPRCEIDIVAEKHKVLYLVEVKYRRTNNQGIGLDYITPKKLKQMAFAAEIYVSTINWQGEYQLAAISVDGEQLTMVKDLT